MTGSDVQWYLENNRLLEAVNYIKQDDMVYQKLETVVSATRLVPDAILNCIIISIKKPKINARKLEPKGAPLRSIIYHRLLLLR